jgi:hypothetical protein
MSLLSREHRSVLLLSFAFSISFSLIVFPSREHRSVLLLPRLILGMEVGLDGAEGLVGEA